MSPTSKRCCKPLCTLLPCRPLVPSLASVCICGRGAASTDAAAMLCNSVELKRPIAHSSHKRSTSASPSIPRELGGTRPASLIGPSRKRWCLPLLRTPGIALWKKGYIDLSKICRCMCRESEILICEIWQCSANVSMMCLQCSANVSMMYLWCVYNLYIDVCVYNVLRNWQFQKTKKIHDLEIHLFSQKTTSWAKKATFLKKYLIFEKIPHFKKNTSF